MLLATSDAMPASSVSGSAATAVAEAMVLPPAKQRKQAEETLLLCIEQFVAPRDGVAHRALASGGIDAVHPSAGGNRCSRRLSSASGGNIEMRAAASSIASGSPSSRVQIAAIVALFSGVSVNAASTARARSQNSSTASFWSLPSDVEKESTGICHSPERPSASRLVMSICNRGQSRRRSETTKLAPGEMLEVVEDEQQASLAEKAGDPREELDLSAAANAKRIGDRGKDRSRLGNRSERHEADVVRDCVPDLSGDFSSQTRFSHATRTGERDEANGLLCKQLRDRGDFARSSNE